jgi:small subunit ribosomal protein S3
MSHTVHPYAHRLGILRDWKSRWFGTRGKYQQFLKTDVLLREYLEERLRGHYIDSIEMERGENVYRVIIKTSRPGMVIGRQGEGSTRLKNDIIKQMRKIGAPMPKELRIDIEEVRTPDAQAAIVAQSIADQLEKRMPFKRIMKGTVEKVLANKDVKGVKITLSGRLGGAEMSRVETIKRGRLPLQTLRADIDFVKYKAHMTYGDIGIKVWIYKGDIFE